MNFTYPQIAKMIDHSLLNPVLTDEELEAGCRLAIEYDVASACVKPYHLKRCSELLAGSTVAASTVIGFPHGGHTTAIKLAEAEQALRDGGTELDMVVNIGKVLSEDWFFVRAGHPGRGAGGAPGRAHWSKSSSKTSISRTSTRSGCAKSAPRPERISCKTSTG